ncbi:MAG: DUF2283 domain-containing protein [Elusimicrobia bacterium]|nr:DUF2283 domain-containing protein [Elusimicrobiota bacterium]
MAKINKLTLGYDPKSDILEVTIGPKAHKAVSVEKEDEVFLRIHPGTGELVGMTILGFRHYLADKLSRKGKPVEFSVAR